MTVESWLTALGLSQYVKNFSDNDVSMELLPRLTGSDLLEMGIASVGHRRILLDAIASVETASDDSAQRERRQITVLFCDMVGSTSLSESLDAEDMDEVLSAYHATCKSILVKHGAYIANFMGDGVMAYFGYPRAREDDTVRAVRASVELLETLRHLKTPAGHGLEARVGLDTGIVVVGDINRETTMGELSAVGKTSNRAARIQSLAKPDEVLVSERTYALCHSHFHFEDMGQMELKGVHGQTGVWKVGAYLSERRFDVDALSPFVGRVAELQHINEAWSRAVAGQGQVITVTAEGGLGKTRLSRMLQEELAEEVHHSFHFSDVPLYSGTAYHTLIAPFLQSSGVTVGDSKEAKREKLGAQMGADLEADAIYIDHLVGALTGHGNTTGLAPLDDPSALKNWLYDCIGTLLAEAEQECPTLIIVDDAQWADASSMGFIDHILDWIKEHRVLLLVMTRPGWSPSWADHEDTNLFSAFTLNALTAPEGRELVNGLTGNMRLPADLTERVVETCDGVPLFLEEVTRGLLERVEADVGERDQKDDWPVPRTLVEAIMSRLDGLGNARQVALCASCIGREFEFGLLRETTGLDNDALHEIVQQLLDMDVFRTHSTAGPGHYRFRHMLVRETAYETLLRSHRRDLHGKIAAAMQGNGQMYTPQTLASHLDRSGQSDAAAPYWLSFAERQIGLGAYGEAVKALYDTREKLAALHEKPDVLARTELKILSALGSSLIAIRPTAADEIGEVYEEAYSLTQHMSAGPEVGFVMFGLAVFFFFRGAFSRTEDLAGKLATLGRELGDPMLEGGARMIKGQITFWRARHHDYQRDHPPFPITDDIPDGNTIARFAQDPVVTSRIPYTWSLNLTGQFEAAESQCQAVMDYAKRMDHPYSTTQVYQILSWHHVVRNDPREALKSATAMLNLAQEQGFMMFLDIANIVRIWAECRLDPLANGCGELNTLVQRTLAADGHLLINASTCLLAEIALLEREYKMGLAAIAAALAEGRTEDCVHVPELLRLKGELLLVQGADEELVRTTYLEALAMAENAGAHVFSLRCATSLAKLSALTKSQYFDDDRIKLNAVFKTLNPPPGLADRAEAERYL